MAGTKRENAQKAVHSAHFYRHLINGASKEGSIVVPLSELRFSWFDYFVAIIAG